MPRFDALRSELGAPWPALAAARSGAEEKVRELHVLLRDAAPADASLVVFGSLARGETTAESDVDWTLLLDGQAQPSHLDAALDIEARLIDAGLKKPGREGTFGGLAFSHDLLHHIGGSDDTNRNTTQRILLLLESHAIGDAAAHHRVVTQVLRRYVDEDFGLLVQGRNFSAVPRFLLNDIVRYWRTVAVDFAYKRRERRSEGWALRTVKLRMSRKLTYASGLAACFSCAMEPEAAAASSPSERALRAVDHLERFLRQPPLEIMAWTVSGHHANDRLREAGRRLFTSYDAFLALLNDPVRRDRLEVLLPEDATADPTYHEAREIGRDFQDALDEIFLSEIGSALYRLTRTYGVF